MVGVYPNEPMQFFMTDGQMLVNQPSAIVSGLTGDGVTVAVVDSGIDTTHAAFAGAVAAEFCFELGAQQVVVGGQPVWVAAGPDDPGFCPNGDDAQAGAGAAADATIGHGSAVAGIIGSRGGDGVAPGMAPEVDLVAYRVGSDRGDGIAQIWTADVIAALDHILDNPGLGIDLVNLSLGSFSTFAAACDSNPAPPPHADAALAYEYYIEQLRLAGVVVVAAAGNQGDEAGLAFPACLSDVVSVGSVYDNDIGSQGFGDGLGGFLCGDATTARDQVSCYSNAASFLDLLAPAHCAATVRALPLGGSSVEPCFGGTSAAAPYAVGAAALLIEDGNTPDEAIDLLINNGADILDTRNGLTFPRIDLAGALLIPATITSTDYANLQEAIDIVPFGGTVQIPAGLHTENVEVPEGKTLDLTGLGATADDTTVAGVAASELPTLTVWEGSVVTLSNLSITDGEDSGIHNHGDLTLDDVVVFENVTLTPVDPPIGFYGGGGILNVAGATLTITGSEIRDNDSTGDPGSVPIGGGISNYGILLIENSSISGNTADELGGGISNNFGATLQVTGTSGLDLNTAAWGGGLYTLAFAEFDGALVTIDGNTATNAGGGIYARGEVSIHNASILNNTVTDPVNGQGGGLAVIGTAPAGTLTMTNGVIESNAALFGAGVAAYGVTTLTGTSILQNITTGGTGGAGLGGGIYYGGPGALSITDGIVGNTGEGNVSAFGGGIAQSGGALTIAGATSIRANGADEGAGVAAWGGTVTVSGTVVVRNNVAVTSSGGIGVLEGQGETSATAVVTGVSLIENEAPIGGALGLRRGSVTLRNATVTDNVSDGPGAAIRNLGGTLTIEDSVFTGNHAGAPSSGGQVASVDLVGTSATTVIRRSSFAPFDAGAHAFVISSQADGGGDAANDVDARFNWWGDAGGPVGGSFEGNVLVDLHCPEEDCLAPDVEVQVTGSGTISAEGLTFNCAAGVCMPASAIGAGTSVAIFATPAVGANFTGWGGACEAGGIFLVPLLDVDEPTIVCTVAFTTPPPPVGGGGGGGGGGAPAPLPSPTPTPTPPVRDSTGVTVPVTDRVTTPPPTSAPASIQTGDGSSTARLTVPPGAIPGAAEISLATITDLPALLEQAPARGVTGLVLAFHVNAVDRNGASITSNFNEPVELEFVVPLDSLPQNVSLLDLTVAFWNGTSWIEVPVSVQRNADGTVTLNASVSHFTIFSVAYRPGMRFSVTPLRPNAVTFAVWGGGTIAEATRAEVGRVAALWVLRGGRFYSYAVGAPAFTNQPFRSQFVNDYIPSNTPIVVVVR